MRYVWQCPQEHETEVDRRVADIDVPPENGCETCASKDLKRIIVVKKNVKGFQLLGGGWHDDEYTSTRSRK